MSEVDDRNKQCGTCGHYRYDHHPSSNSTCLIRHRDHYGPLAFIPQGLANPNTDWGKFCSCLKFNPKPRFEILVREALK